MRGLSPSAARLRESALSTHPEWGLKGAGMRTLGYSFSHPLLACPRRNCDGNPLTAYVLRMGNGIWSGAPGVSSGISE